MTCNTSSSDHHRERMPILQLLFGFLHPCGLLEAQFHKTAGQVAWSFRLQSFCAGCVELRWTELMAPESLTAGNVWRVQKTNWRESSTRFLPLVTSATWSPFSSIIPDATSVSLAASTCGLIVPSLRGLVSRVLTLCQIEVWIAVP